MNDKKRTADWITRTSGIFLGSCAALLIARGCMLTKVHPGEIGVRYSNVGGLVEKDLTPGFRLETHRPPSRMDAAFEVSLPQLH